MSSRMRATTALLLALLASGCGREVVVGGQKEVETKAVGDGTPDGSSSLAPAGGGRFSTATAVVPQGTLTFVSTVSLVAEDGRVFPLTDAPQTTRVRVEGTDRATVSVKQVPADLRYTRARVAFRRVSADVTAGLLVGGISVAGTVEVGIAAGDSVVVERAVSITDPDRARETLLVDLNTSAWITRLGVVPAATFASAVRIRTE